jgi:hypothetical protein
VLFHSFLCSPTSLFSSHSGDRNCMLTHGSLERHLNMVQNEI